MMALRYKRILLKLSGEVLAGTAGKGIDNDTVRSVCSVIKKCAAEGLQIGIVVGGGNFWRGRTSGDMDRVTADSIGMLATVMNSLALCDGLRQIGCEACVMTSVDMVRVAEPYSKNKAEHHLNRGRVVIFGGGTGSPFFSTDTAASLRAIEIDADILFKATNVDGVYDKDPRKFPDAVKYDTLTQDEVLEKHLGVMDSTAAAMCSDNRLPILVFNLNDPENIYRAVHGENIGTIVK
ncbi:MAG: UMP kinase [Clostridia bacterium]|nr:UMP kinase [Clostridia bacterium]